MCSLLSGRLSRWLRWFPRSCIKLPRPAVWWSAQPCTPNCWRIPQAKLDFVDRFLSATGISIDFDLGEPVWRETSVRLEKYAARRRASRGGKAKQLLADFIVGAHALLRSDRLLTLDKSCYSRDFPELQLISPGQE